MMRGRIYNNEKTRGHAVRLWTVRTYDNTVALLHEPRYTYNACAFLLASNYGLRKESWWAGYGRKGRVKSMCDRKLVDNVLSAGEGLCYFNLFVILARTSSCYVGGNQYNLARHDGPLFVLFSHVVRAHARAMSTDDGPARSCVQTAVFIVHYRAYNMYATAYPQIADFLAREVHRGAATARSPLKISTSPRSSELAFRKNRKKKERCAANPDENGICCANVLPSLGSRAKSGEQYRDFNYVLHYQGACEIGSFDDFIGNHEQVSCFAQAKLNNYLKGDRKNGQIF